MRNISSFLFLLLIVTGISTLSVFSQTTKFDYKYDLAGNRTSRIIHLSSKSMQQQAASSATAVEQMEESIAGQALSIYPNPTKGKINVRMKGQTGEDVIVRVFNVQGKLVSNFSVNGTGTEIDLSNQPPGMYVMKITIGKETRNWKIVKNE